MALFFRIICLVFFVGVIFTNAHTQSSDIVTIKTLGQGKTVQDATTQALREAISQAYGVFISANTTIVNDSLLKDEIVSLTTGNIQKYAVLSQTEIPGIGYSVFVNADVSLSKLSSFAQSKGSEATFDGGGFAMNIKLQKLNEQAELIAINNLLNQSWNYINSAICYQVTIGKPTLFPEVNNESYKLQVLVDSGMPDSVKKEFERFLSDYLTKISMSDQEISDYKNLSKPIYHVRFLNSDHSFRNKKSIQSLMVFCLKLNNLFANFELTNSLTPNIQKLIIPQIFNYPIPFSRYDLEYKKGDSPLLCKNWRSLPDFLVKPSRSGVQTFKDSLNAFMQDTKPFDIEDVEDFKNIFYVMEHPGYLMAETGHLGFTVRGILSKYNDSSIILYGVNNVKFGYVLIYSLSELEQLKDFKVTKITN